MLVGKWSQKSKVGRKTPHLESAKGVTVQQNVLVLRTAAAFPELCSRLFNLLVKVYLQR